MHAIEERSEASSGCRQCPVFFAHANLNQLHRISLRHAAFRALRLSSPAYAAAPLVIPARGLIRAAAVPAAAVRWNSYESSSPSYGRQFDGGARRERYGGDNSRRMNTRPERPPPEPCETVYIGNLFFDVTADQLKAHCEQFGEIDSVRIIYDARGLSKG